MTATISVERFNREILLAAGLQHPNIVPVLSAGEFGNLPFFIMPFIEENHRACGLPCITAYSKIHTSFFYSVVRPLGADHRQ